MCKHVSLLHNLHKIHQPSTFQQLRFLPLPNAFSFKACRSWTKDMESCRDDGDGECLDTFWRRCVITTAPARLPHVGWSQQKSRVNWVNGHGCLLYIAVYSKFYMWFWYTTFFLWTRQPKMWNNERVKRLPGCGAPCSIHMPPCPG